MAKNTFHDIDYQAIGKRVREARSRKQMTQEDLAAAIGISTSYTSAIETGASKVALPTLIQLAKALDTTVDTLLYDVTPATVYKYDRDAKILLEDCSESEREYLLELLKVAKEGIRKIKTS